MKKTTLKILKFLAFLTLGVFIFWLIYKDQDIERIKRILKNDVNYFWIGVSLFIGLFSHISRTIRWRLMIEPLSHKPGMINTFLSVMVGYLMNLAFPRMGEVSRCGVLARYEKISFIKLLGTVVAERAVDVISLLILFLFVVFVQFVEVIRFLNGNPEIEAKILSIVTSPVLYFSLIGFILLILLFRNTLKDTVLYRKTAEMLKNLKEGLISIRSIKKKGWFFFHSAAIWIMYYFMLYVVFFAFDFTNHLNPLAGLTTFVLASFGMVAPVQGGIGAWHFMTKEALSLFGVANENGVIFAFVSHTATTGMIIILGLLSVFALPFVNRRKAAKPTVEKA